MKTLILLSVLLISSCAEVFTCSEIVGRIDQYCEPEKDFYISSQGGKIKTAIQIANNTETVTSGWVCESACVMIISRAEKRISCAHTLFGLHQASVPAGTKKMLDFYQEDPRVNFEKVKYYIERYGNNSMYLFYADEAKEYGLIDEIINC